MTKPAKPETRGRMATAVELAVVFGLIMAYMWLLQDEAPALVLVLFGFVIASWVWRRDGLARLGLDPQDFEMAAPLGMGLGVVVAVLILLALWLNPEFLDQKVTSRDMIKRVMEYFGWALFQQLILHGYFTNRVERALRRPWPTALIVGALFASTHLPNSALTAATFLGGVITARMFMKSHNLYPLALAHAVLAVSIHYLFQISTRVGPHY